MLRRSLKYGAALAALCSFHAAAAELVTNGDFNAAAAGWSFGAPPGQSHYVRVAAEFTPAGLNRYLSSGFGAGPLDTVHYATQAVALPADALIEFRVRSALTTVNFPGNPYKGRAVVDFLSTSASAYDPAALPIFVAVDRTHDGAGNYVWTTSTADLSHLAGQSVTLRIAMVTGTRIDDVSLVATPRPKPTTIDRTQPVFTEADPAASGSTITFSGGTLRPTGTAIDADLVAGAEGATIDAAGARLVLSGDATGPGTLTLTGAGTITATGTMAPGAVSLRSGTLDLAGTLAAPLTVDAGARLAGTGTAAGPTTVAGTLAPGNSPGIMVFAGPLVLAPGAVTELDIDGPTAGTGPGYHDQVRAVAGATVTAGGTLRPLLREIPGGATQAYTPALGQRFLVVDAPAGLAGSFAGLDQPPAGLPAGARLEAVYAPGALYLAVAPSDYGAVPGLTPAQAAAGRAVQAARPAPGPRPAGDAAEVFPALYSLGAETLAAALDQLAGTVHAAALTAAEDGRRVASRALRDRLTAPPAAAPVTAWARPLAERATSRGGPGPGHAARTTGGAAGIEFQATPDLRAGLGVSTATTRLDQAGTDADARARSHAATLYATWQSAGPAIGASLTLGVTEQETTRRIAFGGLDRTARADASGRDLAAELAAAWPIDLGAATATPYASIRAARSTRSGWTESGAGSLDLAGSAEAAASVTSEIGARLAVELDADGRRVAPFVSAAWERDWTRARASSAALAGTAYDVEAPGAGRDAAAIGAGITLGLADGAAVEIGYTGRLSEARRSHGVAASVRASF